MDPTMAGGDGTMRNFISLISQYEEDSDSNDMPLCPNSKGDNTDR